jgi:hypothetical protein
MIQGIEIALAVYGLFGLIGGSLIISKSRIVRGPWARLLGAVALVPLIAAFVLIFTVTNEKTLTTIEISLISVFSILVFGLGALFSVKLGEQPVEEEAGEGAEGATEEGGEGTEEGVEGTAEVEDAPTEESEAEEPEVELTDARPVATGPESENLDYFDTIAPHLEYYDMNPEQLDYFDKKAAQSEPANAAPDPLDEAAADPAPPKRRPPRPENRTSFRE